MNCLFIDKQTIDYLQKPCLTVSTCSVMVLRGFGSIVEIFPSEIPETESALLLLLSRFTCTLSVLMTAGAVVSSSKCTQAVGDVADPFSKSPFLGLVFPVVSTSVVIFTFSVHVNHIVA